MKYKKYNWDLEWTFQNLSIEVKFRHWNIFSSTPSQLWMSLHCILEDHFPKATSDRLGFEIIWKTVLISNANCTLITEDFLFSESLTLNYINNKQLLGLRCIKNKAF